MQSLLSTIEPLAMQHGVVVSRQDLRNTVAFFPRRPKSVGIIPAAVEAWPMAGRKRSGVVKEEQLGPAAATHHLAPSPPELADARQPRRARPAFAQQRPGRGVMDDTAIAGEHAAMRIDDDISKRRDPVLQRH
jgi:hypothetical protein